MEGFIYRKAEISDMPTLIKSQMNARLEHFAWDANMQACFRKSDAESIPRLIKEGTLVIFLAYQGKTFAGMGGLYIWRTGIAVGEANIFNFYTVHDFRGQGIMHHLFELLIIAAKENEVKIIKVCETNDNRQRLYHLGFKNIYDKNDDDGIELSDEMEMVLNDFAS